MSVVTRFPPSPTGFMHIGNARTALFNWLYARRHGGKFVVRIEDTDRKRHSEEAVQAIIDGLKWLELDHDGEITSQFANKQRHIDIANELLAAGKAYKCYCSPKAPLDGATTINDRVQGEVTVKNEQLDDFIILRSDGSPTYMLSVVVDDHDMAVTHVLRGDDHLNNTFRQKIIFDAMGWDTPDFGHLPLIHGPDGGKFSKRHGAQSVEEYRDMGYLPEAMRNYLMRLGWSHGNDEIITTAQALEWFNLENIGKAAANFDFSKLESLNSHYIEQCEPVRLMAYAMPFYKSRHDIEPDEAAQKSIIAGIDELKSRAKTLLQFVDESVFYAKSLPFDFDEKATNTLDGASEVLSALNERFLTLEPFDGETIKQTCFDVAADLRDGKMGKVGMPLRAAITGTTVSPSIFDACAILGREETCARLQAAIAKFSK